MLEMSRVHPPHNPSPHCHRNNQSHFKAKYTEQQIIILVRQKKVKEQLVVRKDMDVNEHERLSNITLRHKLK